MLCVTVDRLCAGVMMDRMTGWTGLREVCEHTGHKPLHHAEVMASVTRFLCAQHTITGGGLLFVLFFSVHLSVDNKFQAPVVHKQNAF